MTIGWFVVPYKRINSDNKPTRYCAMQDSDLAIRADGGSWEETEILHTAIPVAGGVSGKAIVKVRASTLTLSDLSTVYRRIPLNLLDDSLSSLTNIQKTAIRNELEDCGYTLSEIQTRFGNDIGIFTLRDILSFATSRRLKPKYDAINDRIIWDSIVHPCRNIIDVDRRCFSDIDIARLINIRDTLLSEWDISHQTIRISQRLPTLPKHERDAILVMCGQAGYFYDKIKPDTFPTTGLVDNFNRADGDDGANWNSTAFWGDNSPEIVSNTVWASTAASAYWSPSTFGPDSEVYETVSTKPGDGGSTYLMVRCAEPGATTLDAYSVKFLPVAGTDTLQVRRIDNATPTTLGADLSQEIATGDTIGLEIIGSTVTIYYKNSGTWSSVGNRTDSTYSSAGYIAHGIFNNLYRGDDFSGGTIGSSSAKDIDRHIIRGAFRGIGRGIA